MDVFILEDNGNIVSVWATQELAEIEISRRIEILCGGDNDYRDDFCIHEVQVEHTPRKAE